MGENLNVAELASIAFSADDLGRLMPFFMLLDDAGVIKAVGPAIQKAVAPAEMVGRPIFDIIRVLKPRWHDPECGLRDVLGERLKLELRDTTEPASATLFGMAIDVWHNGFPEVLVAATPGVNARAFVEQRGLKISDFGPVDGSADLLPLLAMQADMLEDSKKKSNHLIKARDAAERLANHDALTGLPNRRAFMSKLTSAVGRGPVGIVHVDLDRFKEINDTYGHAAGDAALRHAASAISEVFGGEGDCARLGGDEFVAMLEHPPSDEDLKRMSQALLARLKVPFAPDYGQLTIGASIGIARADPSDKLTADDLLHHADLALYEVKRSGRGQISVCSPGLLSEQLAFQSLTTDLRRALAEQEFEAYLQPQIMAETGEVVGFEALVRWNHPTRGLLSPVHFLQQAERAGLMREIDSQVRESSIRTLVASESFDKPIPFISLNVTIEDLVDANFRNNLLQLLDTNGLGVERIQLEIVESVLFDTSPESISAACQSLVDAGFLLALDDFGTGHASVLSLMNLPVTTAKVDRAFANGVARNERTAAMAEALIGIAKTLGLDVLAEGVNDHEDVRLLREMGCEYFQSYLFGRPMAPQEALNWLEGKEAATCGVFGKR